MSTKNHVLTFTGVNETQRLPQGRFFLIHEVSAGGSLNVSARRRNGQPTEFTDVGVGLKYKALESEKWSELVITSAVAQTVEVIVSDEADVDFANAVTVIGTVTLDRPATLDTTADVACGAGAQTQILAARPGRVSALITSLAAAGGAQLRVGDVTAAANAGTPLDPGATIVLDGEAALYVWNPGAGAVSVALNEVVQ